MQFIRPANDRGHFQLDWLSSLHSFSFGEYHDPEFMGFGPLRVINEDRIKPGQGFGTHGHRDMEIISYIIEGALEHKDSMDTGSVMRPGDVQRMSAGTGIRHSEFNHSDSDEVYFLQIWIMPNEEGLPPSYEEKTFSEADKHGKLRLIGSRDGRDGSITIHQDVSLFAAILSDGVALTHELAPGRGVWVQVIRGSLRVNDNALTSGDGFAISDAGQISLVGTSQAEILLFDMPQ